MAIGTVLLHVVAVAGIGRCLGALVVFELADGHGLDLGLISDRDVAVALRQQSDFEALLEDQAVVLCETRGEPEIDLRNALERTSPDAAPESALLVTGDALWMEAAASLGMPVLELDDTDPLPWAVVPFRIARRLFSDDEEALEIAIQAWLESCHGLQDASITALRDGRYRATGKGWQSLHDARLEALDGVEVQLPVEATLRLQGDAPPALERCEPASGALREAVERTLSLQRHGQIARAGAEPGSAATHVVEDSADGRRRLHRRRFSAQ